MSIFEVKNIKKIFQPTNNGASLLAIENVSFKVRAGEFVSIMGPTGCGKTTLLKIISGLEFPTEGEVSFDGQKVSSPKKEIVLISQSEDLLPWRTVTRNIEFGLEVRGVGREDRRKKSGEMIKTVGLSGFEEFYPKNLSGGMRRKVSFIRSVITDPAVMLMDEPFIFLDENTKDELQVFLLLAFFIIKPSVEKPLKQKFDVLLYHEPKSQVLGQKGASVLTAQDKS